MDIHIMHNEFTHGSNCIFINRERVLICKMNDKPNCPVGGHWVFPGGKTDPGESALETLKREVHEEVGLDISNYKTIIPFIKMVSSNWVANYYIILIGDAEVAKMEICQREFSEHRWVSYTEITEMIKSEKCSSHFSKIVDKLINEF